MPNRMQALTLPASGATVAFAPARSLAQQTTKIRVGTMAADFAGEPFYAQEQGFFTKAGLDVDITTLNNGPAIASAIGGGAIDIGYSNVVSLALAYERGLPFKIIFPANMYLATEPTIGLLTVAKSSSIRTAKDFDGKTIGVGGMQTIVPLLARLWIDRNGGDSSTVKFVEIPFAEMFEMVRTQRVDAVQMDRTADPNLGDPNDPLRIIAPTYSAVSTYFAPSVWFTTADFIGKSPDEVRKFKSTMRATALWARAHHSESASILAKYVHQTPEQIGAIPRVVYGTEMTTAMIQPVIDLAARYGMLKASFPAADLMS
jgi:NitT/TauT family transport system substrate-binding protein